MFKTGTFPSVFAGPSTWLLGRRLGQKQSACLFFQREKSIYQRERLGSNFPIHHLLTGELVFLNLNRVCSTGSTYTLNTLTIFKAIGIDGSTFFLSTEVLGYRAILEAMSCCFVSGAALVWGSPKKQLQRSRDWANRLLSNPVSPKKITEVIIHDKSPLLEASDFLM